MSHRFQRGELAVTVNSRAPLLNNGHVVRIVRVLGPVPRQGIEFGYEIERIDGQPFVFTYNRQLGIPVPGGKRTIAPHWQLRRPADAGPGSGTAERLVEQESS
jgi:hypothetical protein